MPDTPRKVIVAVHGIGDQIQYSTPQTVLARFCEYHDEVPAVPLGQFHDGSGGMLSLGTPYGKAMQDYVFTEVYWAGVPREIVERGHELEGTQPWIRTLIGRVQRQAMARETLSDRDFEMIEQVLKEMLESIAVLGRVFYLAGKMGIFYFDLDQVLRDFLGDVQIVTEFKDSHREILALFNRQMATVKKQYPDAEIYFVAHSEGTVVTLLGLLHALCDAEGPDWLPNVRGLMTIGSPIDKHLTLWPELFASLAVPQRRPARPIPWRNYYDHGDPIGFELDQARAHFAEPTAWRGVFDFEAKDDRGFSRYPFPGKAHNDYWHDPEVFAHFIQEVVSPEKLPPNAQEPVKPPTTHWWTPPVSWLGPYLALLAVLFLGVFTLYKAAWAYRAPASKPAVSAATTAALDAATSVPHVFHTVLGISLLVAGLTVMVRIPRLSRRLGWRVAGIAVFLLALAAFQALTCAGSLATCFTLPTAPTEQPLGLVALSLLLAAASWTLSLFFPKWGMRSLLVPGVLCVGIYLYLFLKDAPTPHGPLWPVFLAGALFVYLWWLVALLFDLVFVWHRYIRRSGELKYLKDVRQAALRSGPAGPAGDPLVPAA
jgi:hypothetical protein